MDNLNVRSRISPFIRWPVIITTLVSIFLILYEDMFFYLVEKGITDKWWYEFILENEIINCYLFINLFVFLFGIFIVILKKNIGYKILSVSSVINLLYLFITGLIYLNEYLGEPWLVVYSHAFWNTMLFVFSLLCHRVSSIAYKDQII